VNSFLSINIAVTFGEPKRFIDFLKNFSTALRSQRFLHFSGNQTNAHYIRHVAAEGFFALLTERLGNP